MKFSLFLSGLLFKQVFGVIPSPTANDRTFVVTEGHGLDTYECGGSIPVGNAWLNATIFVGDTVEVDLVQYVSLVIPAWDVDIPQEVDHVYFNGVYEGSFIGSDNAWHLNTFALDIPDVHFNEDNAVSILVDEYNAGWCVSIDWVAIEFDYAEVFPEHEDVLVFGTDSCADLKVTLKFPTSSDSSCNVQASLETTSNTFIASFTEEVYVYPDEDGVGSVEMIFDHSYLGGAGLTGPFLVTGVLVTCDNGSQYLKPEAHTTARYPISEQCPTDSPTASPTGPPGRCGPLFGDRVCDCTGYEQYCNTANGWCGTTSAHEHAQAGDEYDCVSVTLSPTASPTEEEIVAAVGDPHFRSWNGEKFDFHGVCDLVLLHNAAFGNGVGLDIHIRTRKMLQWSYIDVAVARIGKDIVEVKGGVDGGFWINGVQGNGNDDNLIISGYKIRYDMLNDKSEKLEIDLGDGEGIVFKTWNSFVSVSIENPKEDEFMGSVGLMGSFPEGLKIGRDNTIIEEINEFGQNWQVLSTEPKLFRNFDGPQHPQQCEIPSSVDMRRRLAASLVSVEDAKKACAGVSAEDKDLCIFDVMATNDRLSAGAY